MSLSRWLDRLRLRIRSLFRPHTVEHELAGEIALHLDELTREYEARGLGPAEARAAARRDFGSTAAIADACRDTRRTAALEHLLQDVRHAARGLAAQPLLVLAATASIGIAVAANTLVFGIASELLRATPTARDPERLVNIRIDRSSHVSYREWRRLDASGALAGLAGYNIEASVNWRDGDRVVTIAPLIVTANFFDLLGVPTALGRGFTAAEARAEADPHVAVISHGFWQRLGGDPSIVGRDLVVNGAVYRVLGVLPARLRSLPGFGLAPEIYLPQSRSLLPDFDEPYGASVQLVGRLRDDQDLEQGRAALNTVLQREGGRDGRQPRRASLFARVTEGVPDLRDIDAFFTVLLVVALLVLAIACANVAGLNLARGTVRRREIALRLALGATRRRVVQQLLVESVWLAAVGTAGGLVLMGVLMAAVARLPLPLPIPLELHAPSGPAIWGFALLLLVLATLLSGLVPAWQMTRPALVPALKDAEPLGARRRWSMRGLLVATQVAISMVLLVTALLFLRNLARTHLADPGFDVVHTTAAQVTFVIGRHDEAGRIRLLDAAVARISTLPGVERASYSLGLPLTIRHGSTQGSRIWLETEGEARGVDAWWGQNAVGPDYFATMGIPLRSGREFDARDAAAGARVVAVNEAFAARYLGGRPAVGLQLMLPGAERHQSHEIVAVVGNGKYRSLGEAQMPALYFPYAQRPGDGRLAHVIARGPGSGLEVQTSIAAAIGGLDDTAAVEVRAMRDMLAFAFLPSRIGAALLGTLGTLGLVLAMGGLFALLSYAVAQRARELGIRLALGATGPSLVRLVVSDAALLVAAGLAVGLAIAVLVTRPLAAFLVAGLSTTDPATLGGTALLFLLVSAVTAWIPARRAARVDPVDVLRTI